MHNCVEYLIKLLFFCIWALRLGTKTSTAAWKTLCIPGYATECTVTVSMPFIFSNICIKICPEELSHE